MNRTLTHISTLSILAIAAALSACDDGSDDGPVTVNLEFASFSGATAVNCGTTVTGLGSPGVDARIKDLRFYVSNVKLIKSDGSEVALTLGGNDDWNLTSGANSLTLIDLEDGSGTCAGGTAATNALVKGTVPAGSYTGVKMTMGVPFALNHSDYATAVKPLDVQAMAWSWQSGRKFAKIEVTDPGGSTGCTGSPASGETVVCTAPNRMDFTLANFNPTTQKIAVDVKALVAGTDITVNQAGAAGCMSGATDPECLHVFEALAIDWKANGTGTGLPINGGAAQTLFKAIAK